MGRGRLRTWPAATGSARTRPAPQPVGAPSRRPQGALLLAPVLMVVATPLLTGHVPARAQAPSEPDLAEEAEQAYLADCASCHGADGRGTNRGPTLVGVGKASTYYYLSTGRMPIDEPNAEIKRAEPAYSPELVDALVEYVDGFGGRGPDLPHLAPEEADLGRGGRLYRAQCAACHTAAGAGGALLRQEAPPVYHATPVEAAAAIRVGPGTMPAFGEAALSDEDLNDVVAYVEYLSSPQDRGGQPLWHVGPLIEGLVGWVVGLGLLVLLGLWIGKAP